MAWQWSKSIILGKRKKIPDFTRLAGMAAPR
jgi:hypothetical protein